MQKLYIPANRFVLCTVTSTDDSVTATPLVSVILTRKTPPDTDKAEPIILAPLDSLLISLILDSGYLTRMKQTYWPALSRPCDTWVIFCSIPSTIPDATLEKSSLISIRGSFGLPDILFV